MTTTTQSKRIRAGYEPIPGYVLEEVLGRGGFGEVWRASAPGGLKKAVKFVFGTKEQSRAARELRSLERIKGIQHPFLLALERFEAVDDQLVIVTEIADGSLEDVFQQHRERGSCGIPRETLISHLHDASDALDYLHQQYQLQHLDIKPGNLLLIGGHVKVADFGLLKDLREIECSIVGGLTPIYAPPETFDGRPSLHSDQYSLAVMYQELLTGSRPFGGRTIAQLATQHVHSAPNLDPLPPGDRPVVARALEKNPQRRYPSCLAFIDALKASRGRGGRAAVAGELPAADTKVALNGIVSDEAVADLPQLNAAAPATKNATIHHALVVALGGAGAECLRELRRRVADMHSALPFDLHSILIDTDQETVQSMRVGEASDKIAACKSIYIPLRSAHDYREEGTQRLQTISRRWIYNVPRSGSTEGMRPLGRLALVDHGPMVVQRLTAALEEVAAATGDGSLSVYVVGSLSGGTASGIYIDVVHLLRHLLDQAGLVETPILSMLATAALQGDPRNPLGLHDTQAAITELRHFLKVGNGYPGDAGAGWPSVPAARTPLRDVYIVAASSSDSLTPAPVETLTDYIWSDATGAGSLLAAARKLEINETASIVPPSIRSVGVVALGNSDHLERWVLGPPLARALLIQWLGLPSQARKIAAPLAERIARRIGLIGETLVQEAAILLTPDQKRQLSPQATPETLAAVQESAVGTQGFLAVIVNMMHHLYREIMVGLSDRRSDVTTVIECLKLLHQESSGIVTQLRDEPQDRLEGQTAESTIATATRLIAAELAAQVAAELLHLKDSFERFATNLALSIVETSKLQVSDVNPWDEASDEIRSRFAATLVELHESTVNNFLMSPIRDPALCLNGGKVVQDLIEAAVPLITPIVNQHREALRGRGLPDSTASVSATLAYRTEARTQAILGAVGQGSGSGKPRSPLTIEEALIVVKPSLLTFGGLQRLILIVGSEQERTQLEPQVRDVHEGSLTVAVVPGASPRLIHELQQVDLTSILSRLTVLNGSNAQVTSRLSSRRDISW
jgi:hypothetical protein